MDATPNEDTPAGRNPVPENTVEETVLELLDPFSEQVSGHLLAEAAVGWRPSSNSDISLG